MDQTTANNDLHLLDLPIFAGLLPQQREALLRCTTVVGRDPGGILFHEGDPADGFYILRRGRVKMRRISPTGHEVVLHLSEPPNMIGCKGLTLPGSTYPADAVAIDAVVALRFTRQRFLAAIDDRPDVFFSLLIDMNRRLSEIYTLRGAMLEPVEQRIATLLLHQALPPDVPLEAWCGQPLRDVFLTKNLIAAIVGTTTETAIRILSRWRKRGLIASQRGRLRLLDPGAVFALAEGEPGMANALKPASVRV